MYQFTSLWFCSDPFRIDGVKDLHISYDCSFLCHNIQLYPHRPVSLIPNLSSSSSSSSSAPSASSQTENRVRMHLDAVCLLSLPLQSLSLSPSILSLYIHTATYNQVQTNTPIYTRFLLIVISPQIPIPLIVVSSQQRCFARSSATCCTVPWTCRPLVPEHHTTRDHAQLLQRRVVSFSRYFLHW